MTSLSQNQVEALCTFIENELFNKACDHSLQHALNWASQNKFDQYNFIDLIEAHGGYCDCEVTINLPEKGKLVLEGGVQDADDKNPFRTPADHTEAENTLYHKALFSSNSIAKNNYTSENELLLPAPFGFKAKKRVRKSAHFFNGIETELPTEIGLVGAIEPTTAKAFAKRVRDSKIASFSTFSYRDADYYLSRIARVDLEKPMGVYFMEKTGIDGPQIELRIHKVIFRK